MMHSPLPDRVARDVYPLPLLPIRSVELTVNFLVLLVAVRCEGSGMIGMHNFVPEVFLLVTRVLSCLLMLYHHLISIVIANKFILHRQLSSKLFLIFVLLWPI